MDKKIENCKQQLKKYGQTALIRGSGSGFSAYQTKSAEMDFFHGEYPF